MPFDSLAGHEERLRDALGGGADNGRTSRRWSSTTVLDAVQPQWFEQLANPQIKELARATER